MVMTLQTWTIKCEKIEQLMIKVCKYICREFNCVYCKMLGKQCVYVVENVVIIIIILIFCSLNK